MNKFERVKAAIHREPVDRVPYALWRHFPEVDDSAAALAQATLRFHERYGSDVIKLTPRAGDAVRDWGCVESETVMPDGHRPCARHAVTSPAEWRKVRPLDIVESTYGRQLEVLVRIMVDRRTDAPVVPTLFSPLTVARKLSGDRLDEDLRERPEIVIEALEAITETLLRFTIMCIAEEAAGIFYSIQAASRRLHMEEEYARFGEPYDRRILESAMARGHLVIVHAHGEELMFDRLAALPAHAWNWDCRSTPCSTILQGTPPSLAEGKAKVHGAVIGGLDQWKTLRNGTPEQAAAEALEAITETEGVGVIVGPGCVLPMQTPDATLVAVVRALGGRLAPLPGVTL